ncbi:MAG: T9SS type A sorting domain-containing protein, partial [Bacteroidales bacterium]|nr:T9SS type A sorting domain-containing protein [Bacteroidales bacterium]
ALPADGYSFLHWKENGLIVSHDATYRFVMPAADRYLSAYLATNYVTLSLLAHPDSAGLLTGAGNYEPGSEVIISATAQAGYAFEAWLLNGAVFSDTTVFSFIMPDTSMQLVAQFTLQDFQLQLLASPDGSAELSGDGSYTYNQPVDVVATPTEAYDFLHWKAGGQIVSTNPVYSFLMPANDLLLSAHCRLKTFAVTAIPNVSNYGSVTGSGVYSYGQTATLNALPNDGYQFLYWIEDGVQLSSLPEYSFLVYADHNITAVFEVLQSCDPPQGLHAEIISATEALISWIVQGEAQEYALLWGEAGFDPQIEGNLVEGIVTTEYLITNLDYTTVYEVYLRTICTENNVSIWGEPLSFSPLWVSLNAPVETEITVFPNPIFDRLFVDIKNAVAQPPLIQLFAQNGSLTPVQFSKSNNRYVASTQDLPAGLYFLSFASGSKVYH